MPDWRKSEFQYLISEWMNESVSQFSQLCQGQIGFLEDNHGLRVKNQCPFHFLEDKMCTLSCHMFCQQEVFNNNNVHLSCAHQCPERSLIHINLNTIFYTRRAQSYPNNLHKVLYRKTNTCTTHTRAHTHTHMRARTHWLAETGYWY